MAASDYYPSFGTELSTPNTLRRTRRMGCATTTSPGESRRLIHVIERHLRRIEDQLDQTESSDDDRSSPNVKILESSICASSLNVLQSHLLGLDENDDTFVLRRRLAKIYEEVNTTPLAHPVSSGELHRDRAPLKTALEKIDKIVERRSSFISTEDSLKSFYEDARDMFYAALEQNIKGSLFTRIGRQYLSSLKELEKKVRFPSTIQQQMRPLQKAFYPRQARIFDQTEEARNRTIQQEQETSRELFACFSKGLEAIRSKEQARSNAAGYSKGAPRALSQYLNLAKVAELKQVAGTLRSIKDLSYWADIHGVRQIEIAASLAVFESLLETAQDPEASFAERGAAASRLRFFCRSGTDKLARITADLKNLARYQQDLHHRLAYPIVKLVDKVIAIFQREERYLITDEIVERLEQLKILLRRGENMTPKRIKKDLCELYEILADLKPASDYRNLTGLIVSQNELADLDFLVHEVDLSFTAFQEDYDWMDSGKLDF